MPEMKTLNGYEIVDAKARQDIANIKHPTKLSEFENDVGYLTQHQDITGKADKGHKHTLSDVTDYVAPDLTPYALKSDIPSHEGLATEQYVDDAIDNIDIQDSYRLDLTAANETSGFIACDEEQTKFIETLINGGDVCLYIKDYYDGWYYPASVSVTSSGGIYNISKTLSLSAANTSVKGDVYGFAKQGNTWKYCLSNTLEYKLAKKDDIPDTSNFITSIPDEYVTESELEAKGYLTKHQSLEGYAKTTDIPSLDGYATETYVDTAITNAPCKFEVIDVQGVNSEGVPVQAGSDVLERIIAGEKFPFYLYKKDLIGRDAFILPDDFTPIGSSTILMSRIAYTSIEDNVALYSMNYTFSKKDSIWNVRSTYTEVK